MRARSPEQVAHVGMMQRCHNPRDRSFRYYGARGIAVCDRWRGRGGLARFLADMGPRPSPAHTLDRYPDPDGNYEPSNCRWATWKEQGHSSRGLLSPRVARELQLIRGGMSVAEAVAATDHMRQIGRRNHVHPIEARKQGRRL